MRPFLALLACTALCAGEPGTEPIAATIQASAILHRNALVLIQAAVVRPKNDGQGEDQQHAEAPGYVLDAQGMIVTSTQSLIGWSEEGAPPPLLRDVAALTAGGASHPCTLVRHEPALGLTFFKAPEGSGLSPLPAAAARRPALGEQVFSLALANTPFGPTVSADRNFFQLILDRPEALGACWYMNGVAVFDAHGGLLGFQCNLLWPNSQQSEFSCVAPVARVLAAAAGPLPATPAEPPAAP